MSNQTMQQKQQQPVIAQYLERYKDQIANALPKHMAPDRMARIIMTEVRKVPELLKCDPKSLFGAVIQSSQLGLEPGNALGHAYLIPFGKQVNLIIGYRGMIDLARRSGQIVSIEARSVFEQDEFSYNFGLTPDLQHKPTTSPDKGKLTHVYAVARLKDGGIQWDVMTMAEVEAIRAQSKAGKSGPWKTHFEEMAKKTVIRRLFKYLPVSIEMQQAVGLDEQTDAGIPQQNESVISGDFMVMDDEAPQEEPATKTDSVKNKLRAVDTEVEQTGEITPAYIQQQIEAATDQDDLDTACDLINSIENKGEKDKLIKAAGAKQDAFDAEQDKEYKHGKP